MGSQKLDMTEQLTQTKWAMLRQEMRVRLRFFEKIFKGRREMLRSLQGRWDKGRPET